MVDTDRDGLAADRDTRAVDYGAEAAMRHIIRCALHAGLDVHYVYSRAVHEAGFSRYIGNDCEAPFGVWRVTHYSVRGQGRGAPHCVVRVERG